jgi:hypothetical protein
MPVRLQRGYRTAVPVGGTSVLVADPVLNDGGGYIVNPATLRDQLIAGQTVGAVVEQGPFNTYAFDQAVIPINGISFAGAITVVPIPEYLYVNLVEEASLENDGDTVEILPGQNFLVPAGVSAWVNAATSGHAFSAFFISRSANNYPPQLFPGAFPPTGPTGLLTAVPSYLYQEYSDDDDCQAFVRAENDAQQDYVDTFNALNLPIYTGSIISGALLDWVANGIYGIARPWLKINKTAELGPLNTMLLNQQFVPIDGYQQLEPTALSADDDCYKRVITWHYQKGDGKYFSIRWLKRRIMRFLTGVNGTSPPIGETDQISINFGADAVGIRFIGGQRTVIGGCLPNVVWPGALEAIDNLDTVYAAQTPLPYLAVFNEALASGVLELPFQMQFLTSVG